MRCLTLDWLNIKSLEELKNLGKFNKIRAEIKNFGGKTIHVSGRSWEELFNSIQDFNKHLELIEKNEKTVTYFKTKASEYIFYLTELDGEVRMSKLGITASHFSNKRKAKT